VGKVRPGFSQKAVLYLEPSRATATIGCVVLLLIAALVVGGAVSYESWRPDVQTELFGDVSDGTLAIVAGVAGLVGVAAVLGAIVNGRRWRTSRAVKRLSENPLVAGFLPDFGAVSRPVQPASAVPPLDVRVVKPSKLPKPAAKLRHVTVEANVIGRPPLHIAYLRLFENQPRLRTFLDGPWREFGYVYLLKSAAAVTPAELRAARRDGDVAGLFVTTRERLIGELAAHRDVPNPKGRLRIRRVAASTIRVRDRYGSYPIRAVLCHGTFWRQAVDELLARVDLAVVDLSGYTDKNAGTRYEVQRVIDRMPIERVVFLADQRSKTRFLHSELDVAWSQMAAGSPNEGIAPRTAIVAVTDDFRTTSQQNQQGGTDTVQVRLVARRRPTRRLVAMAQQRVEQHAREHPAADVWEPPRTVGSSGTPR
jgi:hypothetical protein